MISLIAALCHNRGIGLKGQLLFPIPEDLRNFRRLTLNHKVFMGRKTFESLPGGALENRDNYVVTRRTDYARENCTIVHDPAFIESYRGKEEEIFIIGGGEVYGQTLPMADKLYLTRIHGEFEADTFFPPMGDGEWELTSQVLSSYKGVEFSMGVYVRREDEVLSYSAEAGRLP